MGVKDVEATDFINKVAEKLEDETEKPHWANFVKTGVAKERAPTQENWWFIRSASILRKLYLKQPLGVQRLRKIYGSAKNLGHQPHHHRKASGAVIRRILQQLEEKGYIEKRDRKGRFLTPEGRSFLDKAAKEVESA